MMSSKKIIIGAVGDAYGIKGWSHLISFTEPADNIFTYPNWYIQTNKNNPNDFQPVQFNDYKPHGNGYVIQFARTQDRDQALLLKGRAIAIDRADLPPTKPDEYYWTDLIGLRITNTQGEFLGVIDHLFATGSNDVIVSVIETKVENHIAKKTLYIPYLKSVIKAVDLDQKTMLVEWTHLDSNG